MNILTTHMITGFTSPHKEGVRPPDHRKPTKISLGWKKSTV